MHFVMKKMQFGILKPSCTAGHLFAALIHALYHNFYHSSVALVFSKEYSRIYSLLPKDRL